jgi:hypothetical protein
MMLKQIFEKTAECLSEQRQFSEDVDIYNEGSGFHELNLIHSFVVASNRVLGEVSPYYEVSIDTGRLDLLLISKCSTIILEAKTRIDYTINSKIKSLTGQILRTNSQDESLKKLLAKKIIGYRSSRWGDNGSAPTYVAGVAYCTNDEARNKWLEKLQNNDQIKDFCFGDATFKQGEKYYTLLYLYKKTNQ